MKFYQREKRVHDGYRLAFDHYYKTTLPKMYDPIVHDIRTGNYDPYRMVTRVSPLKLKFSFSNFIRDLYFPVFDCDNSLHRQSTCATLRKRGLPYYCIISGSDSYWVIVDQAQPLKKCLYLMDELRDCDRRYFEVSNRQDIIRLRALPKNNLLPVFSEDISSGLSQELQDWLNEFKQYWRSDFVQEILGELIGFEFEHRPVGYVPFQHVGNSQFIKSMTGMKSFKNLDL